MVFFPKDKNLGSTWHTVLSASTMGIHIVVATFVGCLTGWYLDKWLDTKPWLTIVMMILGVAAGFKNVFEEVQKIQRQERKAQEAARAAGEEQANNGPGDD